VCVTTVGEWVVTGELVCLRIDFAGLHSLEGGSALSSGSGVAAGSVKDGGLIYRVHGEKFTRLDCRLDEAPLGRLVDNGFSRGVWAATGDSCIFSFSDSGRDVVLGGVGGRADRGPRTSTIFHGIEGRKEDGKGREGQEHRDADQLSIQTTETIAELS
jgi:hypothetical protein